MKADREANPKGFTREEANLALDKVRERYGIHPSGGQQHARGNNSPNAKAAQRNQIGAPLDFEWAYDVDAGANESSLNESAAQSAVQEFPARRLQNDLLVETQQFHYLIRIAECVLPLHCQVEAENAAEAWHQVKQIRNLIEWREISAEELAEIIADEKASDARASKMEHTSLYRSQKGIRR